MNEVFLNLSHNYYLLATASLVTIISLILSVFFYLKSHKSKSLSYEITSINVLRVNANTYNNLTVYFADSQIENFTVSKITIWNSGNITINGSDIAHGDPLRITRVEDVTILDAGTLYKSKKANQFDIELREDLIYVKFDYIDQNEGIVLRVYHTGTSSKSLELLGSIKGIKQIKDITKMRRLAFRILKKIQLNDKKYEFFKRIIIVMYFIGAPIAMLFASFYIPPEETIYVPPSDLGKVVTILMSILFVPTGLILLKRNKPKELSSGDWEDEYL